MSAPKKAATAPAVKKTNYANDSGGGGENDLKKKI
mgnify:CR=1 FL=1